MRVDTNKSSFTINSSENLAVFFFFFKKNPYWMAFV